eukprot:367407_1
MVSILNYWSSKICTFIACIIIGCITIMYTYNIITTKDKQNKWVKAATLITLYFLLIYQCFHAILITPEHLCAELLWMTWLVFLTYKGGMYVIYVARLQIVYRGTIHQIKPWLLGILWFIVIQHFISFWIILSYTIFGLEMYEYIEHSGFANKMTSRLFNVIKKTTMITFVAVSTSILLLIVTGIFNIFIGSSIDAVINCICIICYDKKYNSVYKIFCKKCENIVLCQCCQCKSHNKAAMNMVMKQQTVDSGSSLNKIDVDKSDVDCVEKSNFLTESYDKTQQVHKMQRSDAMDENENVGG